MNTEIPITMMMTLVSRFNNINLICNCMQFLHISCVSRIIIPVKDNWPISYDHTTLLCKV